jgi:uncharacterized repeat protein (TIGR01451 family)
VLFVVFLLVGAAPAFADRAMSTRFSVNDNGNITFAANTLMVCPASTACTAARNTPAISSGTNGALDNNSYNMQYVNTAPGTVGGVATFDSSSATLSLPSTATVLFAGLYWGADTSAGAGGGVVAPNAGIRNQVGFLAPGASGYATVTASQVDNSPAPAQTRYSAFADVTSLVQGAGGGTYAVGNVQAGTGQDRYAGWTLVVAYEDLTQPPRNLTVDDGFITVSSGSPPISIPVSGFRTPPSGPVRTTLGFVAYEGDAGLTGDSATLNTTKLSDPGSPANNFFDSSITNLGANVSTRNPSDVNNWAYDSMLVNANGILPNNATSANIVVTTSGDTYFPAVVTFATDLFAPNITSSKSVANITHPGGPDRRGDVLRYTVSYTNTGSDAAANFAMRDAIPAGSTYVPGSLRIVAGPQAPASPTDALGDDAAEFNSGTGEVVFRLGAGGNATTGGRIAPGETDTVTFDVTINSNVAPGQQIINQANATFTGLTLGTAFTDVSPQVVNTVAVPALVITKTHSGSLVAGLPTTFTLSVSNAGNAATDGSTVTVTDPFPAGSFSSIANAGGAGWSCAINGLTLTCSRSDALAGNDAYPPILVDGTVADPAPATIVNTATVSGGGSDPASASDGGGATGLADLSLSKTVDSTSVFNGDTVTFTLTVQNAGPSSAQNVTVSDPIDPGLSVVDAESTQGSCDLTVSCSLGTLAADSTATITITATVLARDTTISNSASVSSSTPDPDLSNNSDSASVTVLGTADLSIVKTGTANPTQGSAESYTLTIANAGPDTAHGVVVNDSIPSQFTATSATGGGFSCTLPGGAGGTVACTLAALAPTGGSPVQITITGTLAAGSAGQSIADAATISSNTADPDLTDNTATFNQLVGPVADVAIAKAAFLNDGMTPVTTPLQVGNSFIYRLTITNNGPSAANAVTVTDPLPTGITPVNPLPAGCSGTTTVTCSLGTIASGATPTTIDLTVSVGAAAANKASTNTATVSSTTVDPDPTDNSSSTTVGVGNVANLSLTKTATPDTVNAGDTVTFNFAVTNSSPVGETNGGSTGLGTTGAVVTDPLPPGIQFVSSSSCTQAGGTVTCNLGPVAEIQTVTASFVGLILPGFAGTVITNTASVATAAAGGFPALPDLDPSDNTNAASVTVNPQADLSLTKTVSDPNPGTDDEVQYTLTAHNAGPDDASEVTIHDSLPAGLDFLDASPGCDNQTGTVVCDIGTLANGDSASVTIDVRTTAAISGTVVGNLATVSGNELDPNTADNQATASIHVQPLVDLELTKVASNPTPTAGGPVSYTLTLSNNGPSPATGVTLTDPLPSGLSFLSASAAQGSCSASGQTVTCQLGTLAPGGTAIATVTALVAASDAGGTVQNTATATADQPIARPELLSSNALIRPAAGPPPTTADLAITKTVNRMSGRTGEPLTYTITVTNHGPATAVSPTVTDAFSKSVKLVSAHTGTGSCSVRPPLTCNLDSIPSGGTETITVIAKPTSIGTLRNSATVQSATPDPNAANNLAHATTNVHPGPAALRLTKSARISKVAPGQTFSFTIAVRSLGPEPALEVQICDRLGSGMAFTSTDGATFKRGNACWTIASLAKGKVRRFVVHVRALTDPSGASRLTNTATATADGVRKRTAKASVMLAPAPPLSVGVTG